MCMPVLGKHTNAGRSLIYVGPLCGAIVIHTNKLIFEFPQELVKLHHLQMLKILSQQVIVDEQGYSHSILKPGPQFVGLLDLDAGNEQLLQKFGTSDLHMVWHPSKPESVCVCLYDTLVLRD